MALRTKHNILGWIVWSIACAILVGFAIAVADWLAVLLFTGAVATRLTASKLTRVMIGRALKQ